eukprot:SAG25_NODE_75_length_16951_cov_86.523208_1_plen_177_part_00
MAVLSEHQCIPRVAGAFSNCQSTFPKRFPISASDQAMPPRRYSQKIRTITLCARASASHARTDIGRGGTTYHRHHDHAPPASRVLCLESQLGGACARIFGEGLLQGTHKMPLRASHLGPPSHRAHSGGVPRVRRRHDRRNYGHAQKDEKAGRGDTVRTARPGRPQSAYDAGPMSGS